MFDHRQTIDDGLVCVINFFPLTAITLLSLLLLLFSHYYSSLFIAITLLFTAITLLPLLLFSLYCYYSSLYYYYFFAHCSYSFPVAVTLLTWCCSFCPMK